jgi:hypothetical protein
MNNQIFEQLHQILNTLMLIETSGNNTLLMADSIRALNKVADTVAQQLFSNTSASTTTQENGE